MDVLLIIHVQMWESDHKRRLSTRFDAFQLWCWKKNSWQSPRLEEEIKSDNLKEINHEEYSVEDLMLKLKTPNLPTWCEELTDSLKKTGCWKRLKAAGRRRGDRRWRWLGGIINSMEMSLRQSPGGSEAWCAAVHRIKNI